MPDMNGLEFITALKREFGGLPCAVEMLTGVQDELVAVRAMKAGATDYIPKTAEVREGLGHSIESAIEKFRMRHEIEGQRVALEASERNYRAILEGTPHLVWVAGNDGTIAYANRRWLQYTGPKRTTSERFASRK
jgi:DNA-binding NarL/FixJ family response regulator